MAEWQGYLCFEDHSYFGEFKYRPSEGWIDRVGEIVQWRENCCVRANGCNRTYLAGSGLIRTFR
jgi:hypothetical protein